MNTEQDKLVSQLTSLLVLGFVIFVGMKMTFELPQDLVIRLKMRAARDGSKLKDLIAEACRKLLAEEAEQAERGPRKSPFPLIKGGKAKTADALSPDRVDELLWGGSK